MEEPIFSHHSGLMRSIAEADLVHVLEHSAQDFQELSGAALLITGATGFVGSWLLEVVAFANRAAGLNLQLFALIHPTIDVERDAPHVARLDGVKLLRGDIRTLSVGELARQVPEVARLDAIIHTAISVDARTIAADPIPTLDTAVDGTRRALALAEATGASRFLFLSSGAIYGKPSPGVSHIPESHSGGPDPTDPLSVYAEGKRIGEMMCACMARARGLRTVIARGFAFVGPHLPLDRHFAIGNFIRDALNGGPVVVSGDGTPVRSYQYAADMTAWLWALLVRGERGRAYNVGASRAISVGEVARLVATAGNGCEVEIRRSPVEGAVPDHYVPDVSLATTTLNLRETISLEEGIERTMRWHRSMS